MDVSLFHGHREPEDDTLTPTEVNTMATTYDTAFTAQGVPWVTVRKKAIAEVARRAERRGFPKKWLSIKPPTNHGQNESSTGMG